MANVKSMDVDVIVTRASNPKGVTFDLDDGHGKTNTLDFDNNGHPGIMVYFNIVDDSKNPTGLTFKPTPSNALWVNQGTPPVCPTGPSTWDQFVPLSVEQGGKQLMVYFRNMNPNVQFAFTLWFLWPDGTAVDYDPIGNGNNGPR